MIAEIDREALFDAVRGLDRRAFLTGMAGVAGLGAVAACSGVPSVLDKVPVIGSAGAAALELKPTTNWYLRGKRIAPPTLISGYSGRASVAPGEAIPLFVSTVADKWTATAYRIGDYEGKGGALVATAGPFTGKRQPGPRHDSKTRMADAPWTKSAELDSTGWPPGQYVIQLTVDGTSSYAPVTVRSEDAAGKVVVVGSATTFAAYNLWGGRNLYGTEAKDIAARSYAVSLDRPIDATRVIFMMSYEISLARVAESAGVPLAWMTNIDISQNPEILRGARGLISPGHDEYWTPEYREAIVSLRDAGGNVAFMGANAAYARVRLAESENGPGRRIVCYKSAALDPRGNSPDTTTRWRDAPFPKPENQIVGQLYDAFPVQAPMKITDPDFFLFSDTGVREGETFPTLIGDEIDRYYPHDGTPHPIQLPAISPGTCRGKPTWATMSYYTTKSGAGVFSTGTMNWTRALPRENHSTMFTDRTKEFVKTVTRNLVTAMAAGPMGKNHPARDDADDARLPAHNTSGAA